MKIKPSLSKGTRDFLPQEVAKRNYIFNTIKKVFACYGFEQIETPAIERLETLTGKYGEEGDKLLFKILNSGDYWKNIPSEDIASADAQKITKHISEKGLRYDLTVPLARYVVLHQAQLAFPFKRFHIGPVWRADRPQKGRYQEFYQCDADIIGSSSLLNEVELTHIYLEVFSRLGIPVTVRLIHRKMIDEVLDRLQIVRKTEVVTLIDKLDKVAWQGAGGIAEQLSSLGISEEQLQALHRYLLHTTYDSYKEHVANETTQCEVDSVMSHFREDKRVLFDPSLMRGLDYYTGIVWEVTAHGGSLSGSVGGGGRYDNLTEIFGGQNMSGVGISFGIERIYDLMQELNLFPADVVQGVKVLFVPRHAGAESFALAQAQLLRQAGVPAEVFLGNVKKQKQFAYAEQKGISYLIEIGDDEIHSGVFRLRHVSERREEGSGFTTAQLIGKLK